MTRALVDLDEIPWRALDHADVPGFIRALDTGDTTAFGDLYASLCHQGSRNSASTAAVPFLATIAADSRHHACVPTLGLLGGLAIGDHDAGAFPYPPEASGEPTTDAVRTYRAVGTEIPVLSTLLDDPEPTVVTRAAWLCGWFPHHADTVLPRLLSAIERTPDADALHIAAGLLGHLPDEADNWARGIAALCASWPDPPGWAVRTVLDAARSMTRSELDDDALPYFWGDRSGLLASALRLVPPGDRTDAVKALGVLRGRTKSVHGQTGVQEALLQLRLEQVLTGETPDGRLTPEQLVALAELPRYGGVWQFSVLRPNLIDLGLPPEPQELYSHVFGRQR